MAALMRCARCARSLWKLTPTSGGFCCKVCQTLDVLERTTKNRSNLNWRTQREALAQPTRAVLSPDQQSWVAQLQAHLTFASSGLPEPTIGKRPDKQRKPKSNQLINEELPL